MKTIEEMTEIIIHTVKENGAGTSFVELTQACGPAADGGKYIHAGNRPNTVLWAGVSETFLRAIISAQTERKIIPSAVMGFAAIIVYGHDGEMLNVPMAKRITKNDFKSPRWVPTVFRAPEKEAACQT